MLIVPTRIAIAPRMVVYELDPPEICSIPPIMMMPLMALVTLISGVCKAGFTFQITCQPIKQAKTNTMKCERNSGGALIPIPTKAKPTNSSQRKLLPPFEELAVGEAEAVVKTGVGCFSFSFCSLPLSCVTSTFFSTFGGG